MLLLTVLGLVGWAWAADPFIGSWKLNLAKSKVENMPKNEIMVITPQENGFKTSFEGVDGKGKAFHDEWAATYDGKEHPRVGNPNEDVISMKKIDSNAITVVAKKAGKEVSSWRVVISKDGKTQTAVGKVKDSKGQETSETWVYEKQ